MSEHAHNFELVWDREDERLFAFCTSGGIAECSLEIEADEIDHRINAVERLSAEDARLLAQNIQYMLAAGYLIEDMKGRASNAQHSANAYAELLEEKDG